MKSDLQLASRCLWTSNTDAFASASYCNDSYISDCAPKPVLPLVGQSEYTLRLRTSYCNDSLFAVATVFAAYLE